MTESELRDLDARVHREVFGLECSHFTPTGGEYGSHLNGWYTTPLKFAHIPASVPQYTTDIAAAWRVVEKLSEGNLFIVSVFRCPTTQPVGYAARFGGHAVVGQPTAPLAICLAALAATGVQS